MLEPGLTGPAVTYHPPAELLDGLQIEVAGLVTDAGLVISPLTFFCQIPLYLRRSDVRIAHELAALADTRGPTLHQVGMILSVSFVDQGCMEVVKVLR